MRQAVQCEDEAGRHRSRAADEGAERDGGGCQDQGGEQPYRQQTCQPLRAPLRAVIAGRLGEIHGVKGFKVFKRFRRFKGFRRFKVHRIHRFGAPEPAVMNPLNLEPFEPLEPLDP